MTEKEIEFFDRISESWDDDEVLSTPDVVADLLERTGLAESMRVLDLGTGTGVLVPHLRRIVGREGKIVAMDISKGMLEKAVGKYGHLEGVEFVLQDFEKDAPEGRFDLIYLYCVYPHLHCPEVTLRRLVADNLNERGRVVIAFPTTHDFVNRIHGERKAESDMLPSAPDLARRLADAGLTARVVSPANPYVVEIHNS